MPRNSARLTAGGGRRPTIAEIAARAGVSIGAVSYALNGRPGVSAKTRQRILDIADEIGWRPSVAARSLSGSRAHTRRPGRHPTGGHPRRRAVLHAVHRGAGARAVRAAHRAAAAGRRGPPRRHRGDAAVLGRAAHRRHRGHRPVDARTRAIPVLEELQMPAVLAGRPRADTRLPAVWTDDAAAVDAAVDYLVALGHRRIARVAGLPALEHTQVRIAAFRAAVHRHGLGEPQVVETDYTLGGGRPGHPDAAVPPRPADRDHVRQRRDGRRRAQRGTGDGRRRARGTVHRGW